MICNECETVAHCTKHGCIPKQPAPVPENFIDALRFDVAMRDAVPVQEPVAIALNTGTKQGVKWLKNVEHGIPLYTTPPAAQRQWVWLTDEDIEQEFGFIDELLRDCVHRTEAKSREKNT